MSTYNTEVTLVNNSGNDLTLDQSRSSGIDTNDWPAILDAGATVQFSQGWDFQIKFKAWYAASSNDGNEIEFYFYADEAEVFDDNISTDPNGIFVGSNTTNDGPYAVTFTVEGEA